MIALKLLLLRDFLDISPFTTQHMRQHYRKLYTFRYIEGILKAMEVMAGIWLGTTGLPVSNKVENTHEESISKTRKTKYGKTHLVEHEPTNGLMLH